MIFQDAAFAAPDHVLPLVQSRVGDTQIRWAKEILPRIPDSVAVIDDAFRGSGDRKVILIQDAHTNASAQLNEARFIEMALSRLENGGRPARILTEGGSGDLGLSPLRGHRPLAERQIVANKYLQRGLLHGVEYLDLTSNLLFDLGGAEDPDLYRESLQIYRKLVLKRPVLAAHLARLKSLLSVLKTQNFNARLLELDRQLDASGDGTARLDLLIGAAAQAGVKLDRASYPNLAFYRRLKRDEKKTDLAAVQAEQAAFIAGLPESEQRELTRAARSADETVRRGFTALLSEKLAGQPGGFENLRKYLAHERRVRSLKPAELFEESERLESRVVRAMNPGEDALDLLQAARNIRDIEALLLLKLTPDGYSRLQFEGDALRAVTGVLNQKIMDLDSHHDKSVFLEDNVEAVFSLAKRFYDLTLERDRHFVQSIREAEDTTILLITGGFHTPNLKRLLKEEKLSFISIVPQVLHETDTARYERILLSQLPATASSAEALMRAPAVRTSPNSLITEYARGENPPAGIDGFWNEIGSSPAAVAAARLAKSETGDDSGREVTLAVTPDTAAPPSPMSLADMLSDIGVPDTDRPVYERIMKIFVERMKRYVNPHELYLMFAGFKELMERHGLQGLVEALRRAGIVSEAERPESKRKRREFAMVLEPGSEGRDNGYFPMEYKEWFAGNGPVPANAISVRKKSHHKTAFVFSNGSKRYPIKFSRYEHKVVHYVPYFVDADRRTLGVAVYVVDDPELKIDWDGRDVVSNIPYRSIEQNKKARLIKILFVTRRGKVGPDTIMEMGDLLAFRPEVDIEGVLQQQLEDAQREDGDEEGGYTAQGRPLPYKRGEVFRLAGTALMYLLAEDPQKLFYRPRLTTDPLLAKETGNYVKPPLIENTDAGLQLTVFRSGDMEQNFAETLIEYYSAKEVAEGRQNRGHPVNFIVLRQDLDLVPPAGYVEGQDFRIVPVDRLVDDLARRRSDLLKKQPFGPDILKQEDLAMIQSIIVNLRAGAQGLTDEELDDDAQYLEGLLLRMGVLERVDPAARPAARQPQKPISYTTSRAYLRTFGTIFTAGIIRNTAQYDPLALFDLLGAAEKKLDEYEVRQRYTSEQLFVLRDLLIDVNRNSKGWLRSARQGKVSGTGNGEAPDADVIRRLKENADLFSQLLEEVLERLGRNLVPRKLRPTADTEARPVHLPAEAMGLPAIPAPASAAGAPAADTTPDLATTTLDEPAAAPAPAAPAAPTASQLTEKIRKRRAVRALVPIDISESGPDRQKRHQTVTEKTDEIRQQIDGGAKVLSVFTDIVGVALSLDPRRNHKDRKVVSEVTQKLKARIPNKFYQRLIETLFEATPEDQARAGEVHAAAQEIDARVEGSGESVSGEDLRGLLRPDAARLASAQTLTQAAYVEKWAFQAAGDGAPALSEEEFFYAADFGDRVKEFLRVQFHENASVLQSLGLLEPVMDVLFDRELADGRQEADNIRLVYGLYKILSKGQESVLTAAGYAEIFKNDFVVRDASVVVIPSLANWMSEGDPGRTAEDRLGDALFKALPRRASENAVRGSGQSPVLYLTKSELRILEELNELFAAGTGFEVLADLESEILDHLRQHGFEYESTFNDTDGRIAGCVVRLDQPIRDEESGTTIETLRIRLLNREGRAGGSDLLGALAAGVPDAKLFKKKASEALKWRDAELEGSPTAVIGFKTRGSVERYRTAAREWSGRALTNPVILLSQQEMADQAERKHRIAAQKNTEFAQGKKKEIAAVIDKNTQELRNEIVRVMDYLETTQRELKNIVRFSKLGGLRKKLNALSGMDQIREPQDVRSEAEWEQAAAEAEREIRAEMARIRTAIREQRPQGTAMALTALAVRFERTAKGALYDQVPVVPELEFEWQSMGSEKPEVFDALQDEWLKKLSESGFEGVGEFTREKHKGDVSGEQVTSLAFVRTHMLLNASFKNSSGRKEYEINPELLKVLYRRFIESGVFSADPESPTEAEVAFWAGLFSLSQATGVVAANSDQAPYYSAAALVFLNLAEKWEKGNPRPSKPNSDYRTLTLQTKAKIVRDMAAALKNVNPRSPSGLGNWTQAAPQSIVEALASVPAPSEDFKRRVLMGDPATHSLGFMVGCYLNLSATLQFTRAMQLTREPHVQKRIDVWREAGYEEYKRFLYSDSGIDYWGPGEAFYWRMYGHKLYEQSRQLGEPQPTEEQIASWLHPAFGTYINGIWFSPPGWQKLYRMELDEQIGPLTLEQIGALYRYVRELSLPEDPPAPAFEVTEQNLADFNRFFSVISGSDRLLVLMNSDRSVLKDELMFMAPHLIKMLMLRAAIRRAPQTNPSDLSRLPVPVLEGHTKTTPIAIDVKGPAAVRGFLETARNRGLLPAEVTDDPDGLWRETRESYKDTLTKLYAFYGIDIEGRRAQLRESLDQVKAVAEAHRDLGVFIAADDLKRLQARIELFGYEQFPSEEAFLQARREIRNVPYKGPKFAVQVADLAFFKATGRFDADQILMLADHVYKTPIVADGSEAEAYQRMDSLLKQILDEYYRDKYPPTGNEEVIFESMVESSLLSLIFAELASAGAYMISPELVQAVRRVNGRVMGQEPPADPAAVGRWLLEYAISTVAGEIRLKHLSRESQVLGDMILKWSANDRQRAEKIQVEMATYREIGEDGVQAALPKAGVSYLGVGAFIFDEAMNKAVLELYPLPSKEQVREKAAALGFSDPDEVDRLIRMIDYMQGMRLVRGITPMFLNAESAILYGADPLAGDIGWHHRVSAIQALTGYNGPVTPLNSQSQHHDDRRGRDQMEAALYQVAPALSAEQVETVWNRREEYFALKERDRRELRMRVDAFVEERRRQRGVSVSSMPVPSDSVALTLTEAKTDEEKQLLKQAWENLLKTRFEFNDPAQIRAHVERLGAIAQFGRPVGPAASSQTEHLLALATPLYVELRGSLSQNSLTQGQMHGLANLLQLLDGPPAPDLSKWVDMSKAVLVRTGDPSPVEVRVVGLCDTNVRMLLAQEGDNYVGHLEGTGPDLKNYVTATAEKVAAAIAPDGNKIAIAVPADKPLLAVQLEDLRFLIPANKASDPLEFEVTESRHQLIVKRGVEHFGFTEAFIQRLPEIAGKILDAVPDRQNDPMWEWARRVFIALHQPSDVEGRQDAKAVRRVLQEQKVFLEGSPDVPLDYKAYLLIYHLQKEIARRRLASGPQGPIMMGSPQLAPNSYFSTPDPEAADSEDATPARLRQNPGDFIGRATSYLTLAGRHWFIEAVAELGRKSDYPGVLRELIKKMKPESTQDLKIALRQRRRPAPGEGLFDYLAAQAQKHSDSDGRLPTPVVNALLDQLRNEHDMIGSAVINADLVKTGAISDFVGPEEARDTSGRASTLKAEQLMTVVILGLAKSIAGEAIAWGVPQSTLLDGFNRLPLLGRERRTNVAADIRKSDGMKDPSGTPFYGLPTRLRGLRDFYRDQPMRAYLYEDFARRFESLYVMSKDPGKDAEFNLEFFLLFDQLSIAIAQAQNGHPGGPGAVGPVQKAPSNLVGPVKGNVMLILRPVLGPQITQAWIEGYFRQPEVRGARLAASKLSAKRSRDLSWFAIKVFDAQKRTGRIAVGPDLLDIELSADGKQLLVQGITNRPITLNVKQLIQKRKRTAGAAAVQISKSELLLQIQSILAAETSDVKRALQSAPAAPRTPAVLEFYLNGFVTREFYGPFTDLLVHELKAVSGQNAKVVLRGEAKLVRHVLARAEELYGEGQDFAFVSREELPAAFRDKGIGSVAVVAGKADLRRLKQGEKRFILRRMSDRSLPNLRAALATAAFEARTDLERFDADFASLKRAYEILLGRPIRNQKEFADVLAGLEADADKVWAYSVPLHPIAVSALLQTYALLSRQIRQSA